MQLEPNMIYKMEVALVTIISVLCSILISKLLYKLRLALPWRVNCWFCNHNFWLTFITRNCWTCPQCDQYNGFTKDGDYNKSLCTSTEQICKTPKTLQKSPPKNGLCKMCNINQQLKVVQLSNFVPMNERNFNQEVEVYKAQLEKAYRLCTPCRKVVQMKLHKEKEMFLGSKLLESRTPEKNSKSNKSDNKMLKNVLNQTSKLVAGMLLILMARECYHNVQKHESLLYTLNTMKDISLDLTNRIFAIVKMKTLMTFPILENYLLYLEENYLFEMPQMKYANEMFSNIDHYISMIQKALGGFVCLIQIIGTIWNINELKYTIIIDLLWTVFVITSIVHQPESFDPLMMSILKLTSIVAVLLVYKMMKRKVIVPKLMMTPKKNKCLAKDPKNVQVDEEDTLSLDTDDDVPLSIFGLHNFSDSSNETINTKNNTINGRTFTPHNDSVWSKPKHNSTFSVNSVNCNSPVSDNVFIKPSHSSFDKYQKLGKDDSDSELDESISSLYIGSPKKRKTNNSIFSLRKFVTAPSFLVPTAINRGRPLISPSKLGHSTSWVAGGYWGSEGERQLFNIGGSRSSSQSSGFESQASSMNQRNLFSQPPSREESICGEPMVVDNLRSSSAVSFSNHQAPQSFSQISSPVFPQMQYNSHVHIPQPRFAQHAVPQNVFAQPNRFVQNNSFIPPGGSGLIKLPQLSSLSK